ncbi:MAG: FG-GAP repeat domain-containing protein, partial [Actinomycetota bacterium]
MRRAILLVIFLAALPSDSSLAGHGSEAGAAIRPGWAQVTDDPRTGGQMNIPIEGSSGFSGWFKHSSPTLADLDGDPALEIVIGSLDGKVYVWNADGSRAPGWPRRLDAPSTPAGPINGTLAVGDLEGDGSNDVVVGSDNGWVFAFDGRGNVMPGWPQFTGYNADFPSRCAVAACTGVFAGPTLADLDADGRLEVIAGSFSHQMWVWRFDGQPLPGWPRDVFDGIASSAAVGDLDRDGSPEIVVGSDVESDCDSCQPYGRLTRGGLVHAFRVDGNELPGWPVATDSFMVSSPALADLNRDGSLEVIAGGGFFIVEQQVRGRHLHAWDAGGRLLWRLDTRDVVTANPAVGDLNGDGAADLSVANLADATVSVLLGAGDGTFADKVD